ncbi:hypothetical protein SNOG_01041 [Parastagonospora nodorum SN15]|uniref:Uncharacterized protein n=1 Tax=Phaeosphaeria nodorum (strain SN15 / ATCC MYA-4574 / FGSC 10173) TaxID=321614 RepID=Q0V4M3_PHANO|nr:hypothetical protein SNOG_01041 [Parastagonospora nodorum SN15]EAT92536.1 hypothetical protein SNOG_01041 [Parastagonospora nodorum SN15]
MATRRLLWWIETVSTEIQGGLCPDYAHTVILMADDTGMLTFSLPQYAPISVMYSYNGSYPSKRFIRAVTNGLALRRFPTLNVAYHAIPAAV